MPSHRHTSPARSHSIGPCECRSWAAWGPLRGYSLWRPGEPIEPGAETLGPGHGLPAGGRLGTCLRVLAMSLRVFQRQATLDDDLVDALVLEVPNDVVH